LSGIGIKIIFQPVQPVKLQSVCIVLMVLRLVLILQF